MNGLPILYSFRRCPYAMRARMALLISEHVCELREVVLRDKPAELLALSPKATVPVMVLPDGKVIDQSLDIMLWALGRNDPENWLNGHDATLIARNDGQFKHHLDRYKYPERHASDAIEHRSAGLEMLHSLEGRLERATHLCGDARSITDIAIMPFVRQFAATDWAWFAAQDLPQVQRWVHVHEHSALFLASMVRLPQWQNGADPILLGQDPMWDDSAVYTRCNAEGC
jgi:glutathione S-transferase